MLKTEGKPEKTRWSKTATWQHWVEMTYFLSFRKWKLLSTEVDWVLVGLRWSSAPYKPLLGALHLPEVKLWKLWNIYLFVCISQTFIACLYFIWTAFLFHLTNQKANVRELVSWIGLKVSWQLLWRYWYIVVVLTLVSETSFIVNTLWQCIPCS